MKYIQKDIHYSITKKEQGILKIRRKYNNLSGCRTLSLFTYTTFYVFSGRKILILSPYSIYCLFFGSLTISAIDVTAPAIPCKSVGIIIFVDSPLARFSNALNPSNVI